MAAMRTALVMLALAAGIAPALAQKAAITEQDCRQLVDYVAAPDVAYKPGVDARGRPVAPADLNQSQIAVPQSFTIDLAVSLQGFGIPSTSTLFEPTASIGKLTVEDGGRRVLYNGQPLGNTEQQALAEACKKLQAQQPQARPMTGPMKLR